MKKEEGSLHVQFLIKRLYTVFAMLAGCALCVGALLGIRGFFMEQKKRQAIEQRGDVEILVLGDSIWDLERGETGIAAFLEKELDNVTVYNCTIKGSRASEDAYGLYAMAEYIAGKRQIAFPADAAAAEVLQQVDFSNLDYIVLAYGLNDYFGAVRRKNPEDCYDVSTYEGALCTSIELLRESCPAAEFIILSPTYCQGYSYGQVVHESTSYDFGAGTGPDYVASAKRIAEAYGYLFVDCYEGLDISIHNGAAYLEDATHLSEIGRKAYAQNLAAHFIRKWQESGEMHAE